MRLQVQHLPGRQHSFMEIDHEIFSAVISLHEQCSWKAIVLPSLSAAGLAAAFGLASASTNVKSVRQSFLRPHYFLYHQFDSSLV